MPDSVTARCGGCARCNVSYGGVCGMSVSGYASSGCVSTICKELEAGDGIVVVVVSGVGIVCL